MLRPFLALLYISFAILPVIASPAQGRSDEKAVEGILGQGTKFQHGIQDLHHPQQMPDVTLVYKRQANETTTSTEATTASDPTTTKIHPNTSTSEEESTTTEDSDHTTSNNHITKTPFTSPIIRTITGSQGERSTITEYTVVTPTQQPGPTGTGTATRPPPGLQTDSFGTKLRPNQGSVAIVAGLVAWACFKS